MTYLRLFVCLILIFCSAKIALASDKDTLLAHQYLEQARNAYELAQYQHSAALSQQALRLYENVLGAMHPLVAQAHSELGYCLMEQGKLPEAHEHFEKAMLIYSNTPKAYAALAQTFNDLGNYFMRVGNYNAAIEQHQKALVIRQKILGEMHPDTADSWDNIGLIYAATGDYAEALSIHQKALAMRQKSLGEAHPDAAFSHQNIGNDYYYAMRYDEALTHYRQALAIRERVFGKQHPKSAQLYNNIGNCLLEKMQYAEAQVFFENALRIFKKIYGDKHSSVAQAYNNIGNCYSKRANFTPALAQYEKALSIQQTLGQQKHPSTADVLDNLGHCYMENGDYGKAIEYYQQSTDIRQQLFDKNHPYLSHSYENFGLCHQAMGNYDQALTYFKKSLAIRQQSFGETSSLVAGTFRNIGNCYFKNNRYPEALQYYERATRILQKNQQTNSIEQASMLGNIGKCYSQMNKPQEALSQLRKAAKLTAQHIGTNNSIVANYHTDMGNIFAQMGEYKQAQAQYAQATKALSFEANREQLWQGVYSMTSLLEVLSKKGDAHLQAFLQNKQADELAEAAKTYDLAAKALSVVRREYQGELSKKMLLDYYYAIYEKWIQVSLLQGNEAGKLRAFALAEQSKSLLLLDALREEENLPQASILQKREIKKNIATLEKERFEATEQGNKQRILYFNEQIIALYQTRDSLQRALEKKFPQHFKSHQADSSISVAAVQKQLAAEQALIAYFVGDSSIFVFIIEKKQYRTLTLRKDFALEEAVMNCRKSIQYYFIAGNMANSAYQRASDLYANAAYELYEKIFQPLHNLKLPKRLIIVPDGALAILPFEVLLTQRPLDSHRFKTHRYLIHEYQFSYAYSATLLYMNAEQPSKHPQKGMLAVAPIFQDTTRNNQISMLKHNLTEVENIRRKIGGDVLLKEKATLAAFLEKAADYRILHLATHAKANLNMGEYSYLLFHRATQDTMPYEKLYAKDIAAMNLPCDMVVLSACETGSGEFQRGEGIIGLARAFSEAGAKSVITTLWRVNDAKAAVLMSSFYKYLQEGKCKDEALHLAKISYLNKNTHDDCHPFYWAAYIGIGNMQPLEREKSGWGYALAAGLLAALAWAGRFFFKKKSA